MDAREAEVTRREANVEAVLEAADERDHRADIRDVQADVRDLEAEHVATTFGADYSIDDARPFHARRLAKKDRLDSRADRAASKEDREGLAEGREGETEG